MSPCSAFRTLCLAALCGLAAGCKHETPGYGAIVEAQSLGDGYLDANDLPRAEAAYKRLISLTPNDAPAHVKLGIVYTRMNRSRDAERAFRNAASLDTADVDARLLLAHVAAENGRRDDARKILESLASRQPVDPKVYYGLAELARTDPDPVKGSADESAALGKLTEIDPASIPVRLAYARVLARTNDADGSLRELEELEQLPPSLPQDARTSFDRAVASLRKNDIASANAALADVQRFLEATVAFQSGLETLRAPQIAVVGLPKLSFPSAELMRQRLARTGNSVDSTISFVDVAQSLPTVSAGDAGAFALAVGDYDGDGSDDFLIATGTSDHAVLAHWEDGHWVDAASKAGVNVVGATAATFADVDNDGRFDLFVVDATGRGYLGMNDGNGHFRDVASRAGLQTLPRTTKVIGVDIDHDGDIDLVLATTEGLRLYRNNGDGTFVDATSMVGAATRGAVSDVAFGDLDDDGLIDLVAIGSEGVSYLHNDRQRRFENRATFAGIATVQGDAIAIGDYDNDGYLDLFAGGRLYRNLRDRHFALDDHSRFSIPGEIRDARFVDYDNDGRLDLLVAAEQGVRLYHNDGSGTFSDRTTLLPAVKSPFALAYSDIDRDRDVDFLALGADGLHVFRNDGGNRNLAIQLALKGLITGSGKNNALGIGATLDVRVGDVFLRRTVTERVTTIGLGPHLKADVVRIGWPNGVPQILYYPGSDQDVVENQVLKSSCGFLYAWNGNQFEFTTDVMWRSALGMPVGIGGNGSANYAPAAASKEYLKIPRGALVADHGRYRLQLTEELWETSYTDEIALVAVDHPDSVDMVVDERFVPPGPPVALDLFATRRVRPPASAVDDKGNDLMPVLRDADFRYAADLTRERFQGVTRPHDLIIDLGADLGDGQLLLLLRGWVFPTDASINVALSQGKTNPVAWPVLEAKNARGEWTPIVTDLSIPSGKNKLVVVDLTGKIHGPDHRVRLRTNVQIYWDQVSVSTTAPSAPRSVTRLKPVSADLHYRGFSRMYRRGGRYGPHWFDYSTVTTTPIWRAIEGNFTRYGDVRELLMASDDQYIVMAPGDETTIEFDAGALPALPAGWTREYFIYSDGWIKDADLNTAHGGTVAPLPFHGMTQYPYGSRERYPSDAARQRYLKTYQTRTVGDSQRR